MRTRPPVCNGSKSADWRTRFLRLGALWTAENDRSPHVATSSGGFHVDRYFNSDIVLASPRLTTEIVDSVLSPRVSHLERPPDWVVTYAPFGLFLAFAVAQALGARCAYVDPADGYATHFDIGESDSALIVADDIYSGTSVLRTLERVEERGAQVIPTIFCLANMAGAPCLEGNEIIPAVALDARRYPPTQCPLCAAGSEALLPRPNWSMLCRPSKTVSSGRDPEG